MKKVLHVITGLNDGGAEAVLSRLCINDVVCENVVVSMMGLGKYGPILSAKGIAVHCLNMPQGAIAFSGLWRLWRLLRVIRPDIVQTWMYHADLIGGVLAKLAGVKRIFWGIRHSNLDPSQSKRSTILIAKLCARLSGWVPTAIICCADSAKDIHVELGYKCEKFIVIPNGYDLQKFTPKLAVASEDLDFPGVGRPYVLGMVGRFDPQKDHRNLLKAISLLKSERHFVSLMLVGRGLDESNAQIHAWIDEFDLRSIVDLRGAQNDIPEIMRSLDLHVLSSAYGEAFPNVLAEAMACGIPCVTTDVGDAALIVGSTGWVVPPADSEALAEALRAALSEMGRPSQWVDRCAIARDHVKSRFSLDRMIKMYHSVWGVSVF